MITGHVPQGFVGSGLDVESFSLLEMPRFSDGTYFVCKKWSGTYPKPQQILKPPYSPPKCTVVLRSSITKEWGTSMNVIWCYMYISIYIYLELRNVQKKCHNQLWQNFLPLTLEMATLKKNSRCYPKMPQSSFWSTKIPIVLCTMEAQNICYHKPMIQ